MGKHDREHKGDGAWPKDKPLPKEDVRNDWKDEGGKHSTGKQDDDKQDKQDDDK